MLLGPPNKGVHIVVWGDCELGTERVKMWLGLPADTLHRIGYKNIKADYVLPVPLRGTVENPRVDWSGASEEISKLAFSQLVGDSIPDDGGQMESYWHSKLLSSARNAVMRTVSENSEFAVPSKSRPLPWDEHKQDS